MLKFEIIKESFIQLLAALAVASSASCHALVVTALLQHGWYSAGSMGILMMKRRDGPRKSTGFSVQARR